MREALKTLLGEGLLDHQPKLGYTVTALSQAELRAQRVHRSTF